MRHLSAITMVGLAVAVSLTLVVPVTEGPIASVAMAKKKCGGEGQRACTIFERPGKPCDARLTQTTRNNFDLGTCEKNYTIVPGSNETNHRNPPPGGNAESYVPPPRARDDGRYNDHGGATAIRVCNNSNTREIYAALGYYDWGIYGDPPNWSSAGWWSLKQGECNEIGLIDDEEYPYAGQVYLMAVGGGLAWEGNGGSFCVDRGGEFRIKNADRKRCTDENTLYGVEFIVNPGVLNHFDFDG